MKFLETLSSIQRQLKIDNIEGWLFYDFRRNNELACRVLEIPSTTMLTRRFFYWVPSEGNPTKIVSAIEPHGLAHLPGDQKLYHSWTELRDLLRETLRNVRRIAMEYSPENAIPTVSKVDGGTLEMIRSGGIEVVTSANLLQRLTSIWTPHQLETHRAAAEILNKTVEYGWNWVVQNLKNGNTFTEYDLQQEILQKIHEKGGTTEGEPICAVNEHSADPHYIPTKSKATPIRKGDFLLIDLWAKQKQADAVYADFTQVASIGRTPSAKHQQIFRIVRAAQKKGVDFLQEHLKEGKEIQGWEVDRVCRDVIVQAGYGKYFIHRTGHNIDIHDHGAGANLDDFETHDTRPLLPGTCFSIEPGIYLPGEFGIRLELNVYLHSHHTLEVSGKIQEEIPVIPLFG